MPLNIGSGNSKPFVKYNSKADKWFFPGDQEIGRPTFLVDFDNIATGYLRKAYPFRSGHARCGDRRALTV